MYISNSSADKNDQYTPIQHNQNVYSNEVKRSAGKIDFSASSSRLFAYNNAIPPINYDIIGEDYEFRDYLQKKYEFLYGAWRMSNFNINDVRPDIKRDILLKYTEFVELKESWFKTNRVSKKNSPVIDRAALEAWIKRNIQFCGLKDEKTGEVFKPQHPLNIIEEKVIKLLLPNLELLAKKFPAAMNILINNKYIKIRIHPGKTYFGKERNNGKGLAAIGLSNNPYDPMIFGLSENDLFAEGLAYKFTNIMARHELFHLVDLTTDSSCIHRRKKHMHYVYILDKRLNGRLTELLKEENKKGQNFLKDFAPLSHIQLSIPEGYTIEQLDFKKSEERILETSLIEINQLTQKHKIAYPISPSLKPVSKGKYIIGLNNFDLDLSLIEIFPRIIEAYLFNNDLFKQYSPELYDIVEKEIMPDFK